MSATEPAQPTVNRRAFLGAVVGAAAAGSVATGTASAQDGNESDGGDANESDGGDGNESDGGDDDLQSLIDECDFVLDGLTAGWEGISPSAIEGETNPPLEVEAGESYTIGWINGDGVPHNIAIWNADDESLQATENITEEGATQTLEFEAAGETASYVCEVHASTMIGDLDVGGDGGGGGGTANIPLIPGVVASLGIIGGVTVALSRWIGAGRDRART